MKGIGSWRRWPANNQKQGSHTNDSLKYKSQTERKTAMTRKILIATSLTLLSVLALLGLELGGLPTNLSEPAAANTASGDPVGISLAAEPLSTCCDSVKPVAVNQKLRYLGFSEGSHVVELTFDYVISSCGTINTSSFTAPVITLNFANGVKRQRTNIPLTGFARFSTGAQGASGTCVMPQITISGQPGDGRPISYFAGIGIQATVNAAGGGGASGNF